MAYGKYSGTVERPRAVADFYHEWMPFNAPKHWASDWEQFKLGLHDTGWITDWQLKNWAMPEL